MNDPIQPVDLNHANRDDLQALPAIKAEWVDLILKARPFSSLDQFRRTCQIPKPAFKALKPYVFVGQPVEPVPAASSLETNVPETGEPEGGALASPLPIENQALFGDNPVNQSSKTVLMPDALPESLVEVEPVVSNLEPEPANPPVQTPEITPPDPGAAGGVEPAPAPPQVSSPIAPSQTPTPTPLPPAAPHPKAAPLTRRELLAWVSATALVTTFVSILLTLGILSMINGGLNFITTAQFNTLNRQVDNLNSQAKTLATDLDGLRSRLDTLASLSGRINTVEKDTQAIHTQLDDTAKQFTQIQDQIGTLKQSIQDLQKNNQNFKNFLDGLRSLLNGATQP
jgi:prefoldin subunit 5